MRSIEEVEVYEETTDKTAVGVIRLFKILFQADSLLGVSHIQYLDRELPFTFPINSYAIVVLASNAEVPYLCLSHLFSPVSGH